ncbi:ABC-type multidrug transport system, ATPase and permease component [Saprospira grandis DSM 2844]|uniref:ABC-type multidrug transport system, ATPase and permease component n=1 Tax=Saprospira grandis DSM 2844 TaxID=694433 RepID=J1I1V3_9BACT|nr:ABC transporter transmembrane domain-containing protein [Saprospira grandis]EJF52248.1 ABC-type multidrug transport system, ATPase and permease component [Saprospira grandis DSM 2844]
MSKQDDQAPKGQKKLKKDGLKRAFKLLAYIKPYRTAFGLSLILLMLGSSVFLVFPWAAGELLAIADPDREAAYGLTFNSIGWLLLALLISQASFSYIRTLLITYVSEKSMADIRKDLYSQLVRQPIHFFEQRRVGELSSRATTDVQQLQDAISITLAEFIRQLIILIGGLSFIAVIAPKLTLIMLGTFPVVIIIAMVFGRYIRKLSKNRQDELAATNVILDETLSAIAVVKAFTSEWFERKRYGRSVDNVVQISLRFARVRGLFIAFIIAVLFGAIFFILWIGASMIDEADPNGFHSDDFVQFITYTALLGGSLFSLGNFYEQLVRAVGASERILDILEQDTEIAAEAPEGELRLQGNIRFEQLAFSYPSRPDIQVLKNINFELAAGEKVALVGSSGAGKSTIVQLLLRYYQQQQGKILIDGQDISGYNLSQLRQNMAIVPQEVMMFGGTIRENIAYGKLSASKEELIEAAKKANAWEFIQQFPEGLDTIVGERGITLSGGQRQRIAIARAILKDPKILLLDEATSALDAESERLVQEALNTLMQGRSSIIIAHRLATIREVDRIYVLEHGEIIEQGNHQELSQKEDGVYQQLAKLQFEH